MHADRSPLALGSALAFLPFQFSSLPRHPQKNIDHKRGWRHSANAQTRIYCVLHRRHHHQHRQQEQRHCYCFHVSLSTRRQKPAATYLNPLASLATTNPAELGRRLSPPLHDASHTPSPNAPHESVVTINNIRSENRFQAHVIQGIDASTTLAATHSQYGVRTVTE